VSAFLCAGRFLALLSNIKESRWKQLSTFLMAFRRRQARKIVLALHPEALESENLRELVSARFI
jgi:hypothetical protein